MKKFIHISFFLSGVVVVLMLIVTAVSTKGHYQQQTALLEQTPFTCGPNSYLEYVGEFHIDWGGPELTYKDFHLISIYSLIDPAGSAQERRLELQFVAGELPAVIGSETSRQAPYGARLYQATYGTIQQGAYQTKDLLYNNKKNGQPFAYPTNNAGRPDEGHPFIAFAGVEAAYPEQEHGSFANEMWDYTIACEQETLSDPFRWVFKAFAPSAQSSGYDFVIKTYIDGSSWKQAIVDAQQPLDYMFYTNVMIPSGGEYNLDGYLTSDHIEIEAAEIVTAVIHSSAGQPWGSFDSGGINDYSSGRFNDPNRIESTNWHLPNQYNGPNGPGVSKPPTWIGWFVKNGKSYDDAYDNLVHQFLARNVTEGYQLSFSSEDGYYPKVFCGPTWTISLSDDKLAYCEMWFSPNAPSFWHGPTGLADFSGFNLTFTPLLLSEVYTEFGYLPLVLK